MQWQKQQKAVDISKNEPFVHKTLAFFLRQPVDTRGLTWPVLILTQTQFERCLTRNPNHTAAEPNFFAPNWSH